MKRTSEFCNAVHLRLEFDFQLRTELGNLTINCGQLLSLAPRGFKTKVCFAEQGGQSRRVELERLRMLAQQRSYEAEKLQAKQGRAGSLVDPQGTPHQFRYINKVMCNGYGDVWLELVEHNEFEHGESVEGNA